MPVLAPYEMIAIKDAKEEGWKKGREEGREEGKEEGIGLGELREAQSVVVDILEDRFGNLPDKIKVDVQRIVDISRVRHLRKQAIKVETVQDFEALLRNQ